jgi:hypothetical protein
MPVHSLLNYVSMGRVNVKIFVPTFFTNDFLHDDTAFWDVKQRILICTIVWD